MLRIPTRGFYRSVRKHNIDIDACCDWLEASALFENEPVTAGDVIDVLREAELYSDQGFAWEFISDVFSNLSRRALILGDNYPCLIRNRNRLISKGDWTQHSAYAFCLTLSLVNLYPERAASFGPDYTMQGELFEKLTEEALAAHYIGWTVRSTGWTRTQANRLADVVANVSAWLGEATGELSPWTRTSANEAGLDLLCYREYQDARGGYPVFLMQCASGKDWEKKLHTPPLRVWQRIITFPNDPKKAFSMPFALSRETFQRSCNLVNGLLLDRSRLLAPGSQQAVWITPETSNRLQTWTEQRIPSLPVPDAAGIM